MIDVSEIDLDKLTTLELWELHYRVAARLGNVDPFKTPHFSCQMHWHDSHAARARMKALL